MPGLYVIDSVVRQSRHQFGAQKDVFASRFTKNIVNTFQNLFKCPPDERVSTIYYSLAITQTSLLAQAK